MLGIDGKVVMPMGAPKSKVAATRDYSAEVVLHGELQRHHRQSERNRRDGRAHFYSALR
jgi:threonine dehydratase